MSPEEMLEKLKQLQRAVIHQKSEDVKTKYEVSAMFATLREYVKYQTPMPPIEVSEDGHKFTCPRCGTKFDSEDHVDDFNGCYICLQRWKKKKKED